MQSHSQSHSQSLSQTYLWTREGLYEPRIAAVHDLCGYGKCSLGVAIPVLSAAGCDVCPVPTSLFSAHTLFQDFYMLDTTKMLKPYLDAWVKEHVEIDAIYSGFLGAPEQVASIQRLYKEYPEALRILDPVMGDAGNMYPTYTPQLCAAMKALVPGAHVLLPNLTEASILTGMAYTGQDIDRAHAEKLIDALLNQGAKTVVLKGAEHTPDTITNYVKSSSSNLECIETKKIPIALHGTGDLFASATLAALMCGTSIIKAVEFATQFVVDAIAITVEQPQFEMRGVSFESVLGNVTQLLAEAKRC